MKFPVEVGAIYLRLPEVEPANEDFVDRSPVESSGGEASSGWDPYEVWRTRVKDEAELVDLSSRTG